MSRHVWWAAIITLSACTVQKTGTSAKDSAAATTPIPAAAPTPLPLPAPAPNPPFTSKDLETTNPKPAKKPPAKKPTAGGEYDSVLDPVLYIGPDGKVHRIKR